MRRVQPPPAVAKLLLRSCRSAVGLRSASVAMHVTVQKGLTLPIHVRCRTCCDKFHCPFCSTEYYKPSAASRLKVHLKFHFNRAVQHEGHTIHRCGLKCRTQLHYHCIYCHSMLLRKEDFEKHLILCKAKQSLMTPQSVPGPATAEPSPPSGEPGLPSGEPGLPSRELLLPSGEPGPPSRELLPPSAVLVPASGEPRPPSAVPIPPGGESGPPSEEPVPASATPVSASGDPGPPHAESADPGIQALPRKVRMRPVVREKCPMCNVLMNKRNIIKHIDRKHTNPELSDNSKHHLRSECIDEVNGIFSVQKTFQGNGIPLHVQNKAWGENQYVLCESQDCQANMDLAWKSGMKSYRCVHVRSVSHCTSSAKADTLREDSLAKMVESKLLGDYARKSCLVRQSQARENNVPLSVCLNKGFPRAKKTLSVYEPMVSYYSRLGRVMVVFNTRLNSWHCQCSTLGRFCPHIYVAKWHLFQEQPDLFRTVQSTEEVGDLVADTTNHERLGDMDEEGVTDPSSQNSGTL